MKLRYLWKITLDNEWKQGIRSFFNVILYIVGITIIGLLVYFVSLETDTKKSVERSIRKEIKTLGSISIEGNPSDIQYNSNFNLLKVVKSFSGIDACSSGWGNGSLAISGDWRIEYDASELLTILLSIVPVVLLQMRIIHFPYLAWGSLGVSVFLFLGTLILGDQRARTELKRRFHI